MINEPAYEELPTGFTQIMLLSADYVIDPVLIPSSVIFKNNSAGSITISVGTGQLIDTGTSYTLVNVGDSIWLKYLASIRTWVIISEHALGLLNRETYTVAVDTTALSVVGTDYVYFCNGTLTFTLPDATSTSNRYEIKKGGGGTLTIGAVAGLVEGAATAVETVDGTAFTIMSNGTDWSLF